MPIRRINCLRALVFWIFPGVLTAWTAVSAPAASEVVEKDKPAAAGKYPAFGLTDEQATYQHARRVYTTYCAGCHGVDGDGNGPAARFLDPKPRNFKTAQFRFSSRPSGELPTDEDLLRTVTEGLRGTSMSAWNLLPEEDRRAVVTYLKTFAADTWANAVPAPVTAIADDPFFGLDRSEAVRRGEIAYHGLAQCYSCHPVYLSPAGVNEARAAYAQPPLSSTRPDPRRSKQTQSESGQVILPPDFTWDKLKRGKDLRTLYQVVANGIGGAAMPTWKGVLSEEDLWGMAYYVQDLSRHRPTLVTDADLLRHRKQAEEAETARAAYEAEFERTQEAQARAAAESAAQAEAVVAEGSAVQSGAAH